MKCKPRDLLESDSDQLDLTIDNRMSTPKTLLDELRTHSQVDCDTLDAEGEPNTYLDTPGTDNWKSQSQEA